ncbi:serine hydrolase domain-containing protein [soil metagenome]
MIDRRAMMLSAAALAGASGAPALAQGADPYAALDAAMHGLVDEKKLAGVVTLVARKGKLRHIDAYGRLDVSSPEPVRTDSLFRLASMTKPIIGAAMMILWEEGRWTLDDPVSKHIPQFATLKVRTAGGGSEPMASTMTMRQLMSHTAGFGTLADYEKLNLRLGDLQAMIDTLAAMPLYSQPGTDWAYGPCVDIQGYVIEKLSGQSLDVFLKTRIFAPIGMVDTGFWVEPSKVSRVARIHTYADGVVTPLGAPGALLPTSKPKFLSGGGGLIGTAPDYWRFCQMMLDGGSLGGARILKASTVKLMRTNVLPPGVGVDLYGPVVKGLDFGLDFALVRDPTAGPTAQGIDSFYWGGAFGTWFWIDPHNELIVIGLIQNLNGSTPGRGTPPCREISAKAVYAGLRSA